MIKAEKRNDLTGLEYDARYAANNLNLTGLCRLNTFDPIGDNSQLSGRSILSILVNITSCNDSI